MNTDISIKLDFAIPLLSENEVVNQSLEYWKEQGFVCKRLNENISGARGSIKGNKTAFDMRKILSTIEIDTNGKVVSCTMNVNGIYQMFSAWNLTAFQLDLLLFRKHLIGENLQFLRDEFEKDAYSSNLASTLTSGLVDKDISMKWTEKLIELSSESVLPVISEVGKSKIDGKEFHFFKKPNWKIITTVILLCFIAGFVQRLYFSN